MPTIRGKARRRAGERPHLHCPPRRDQGLYQDTNAIRVSDTPDSLVGQCRGGSTSACMPVTRTPLCHWPEVRVFGAPIEQGEEIRRYAQVAASAHVRFLRTAN